MNSSCAPLVYFERKKTGATTWRSNIIACAEAAGADGPEALVPASDMFIEEEYFQWLPLLKAIDERARGSPVDPRNFRLPPAPSQSRSGRQTPFTFMEWGADFAPWGAAAARLWTKFSPTSHVGCKLVLVEVLMTRALLQGVLDNSLHQTCEVTLRKGQIEGLPSILPCSSSLLRLSTGCEKKLTATCPPDPGGGYQDACMIPIVVWQIRAKRSISRGNSSSRTPLPHQSISDGTKA